MPWEFLPQELGYGSGDDVLAAAAGLDRGRSLATATRAVAGQAERAAELIDWSRAAIDGSHIRALNGGPKTGPSPVDHARTDSKHQMITEGGGIPPAVTLTGGNRDGILACPAARSHPAGARPA
ncbi:hypothetical protein [Nocardia gipuzkoensis]